MSITAAPVAISRLPAPTSAIGPTPRPTRDPSIDAVRALSLLTVVLLHSLMVGLEAGPSGPVISNALEAQAWFPAATWLVQVMPLFFIAGGFSAITAWRGMRARGGNAGSYIGSRLVRLLRPAIILVAVLGVALTAMSVAGLPEEIIATAGFRLGQPLWFLAVYLGCSALVPLMASTHERARTATLVALLGAVAAIDAGRITTGIPELGYLNLPFVWLFCQQLGFWLADGSVSLMSRLRRITITAASLAALLGLTASGLYSGDMLINLNPPTAALALLAVAQLMVFSLAQPVIRRWAATPVPARLLGSVGRCSMTIYLWHMPVLVALAGLLLATSADLPEPGGFHWWMSRAPWILAATALLIPVTWFFSRFERRRPGPTAACGVDRAVAGTAFGIIGVVVLLIGGITPLTALAGVLLLGAALACVRGGG